MIACMHIFLQLNLSCSSEKLISLFLYNKGRLRYNIYYLYSRHFQTFPTCNLVLCNNDKCCCSGVVLLQWPNNDIFQLDKITQVTRCHKTADKYNCLFGVSILNLISVFMEKSIQNLTMPCFTCYMQHLDLDNVFLDFGQKSCYIHSMF